MDTLYLIIPCYNEEEVLPETSRQLKAKMLLLMEKRKISADSRIVFVNDGSKDKTWELIEALHKAGRSDLIGFGPKCLVRPRKMAGEAGKPSRGKGANGKGFGQKTANDRSGQGKTKTGGRPKKTLRNVHKKK